MNKTYWLAGLCLVVPVLAGIILSVWLNSQRAATLETLHEEGVLAMYGNQTIGWEELVKYIRTPPTEDGSILRSLEMTPEDVRGLEGENPEFFNSSNGQLLILRMLKHIALVQWLNEQSAPPPDSLDTDVEIHRQQLIMSAMEDSFAEFQPEITEEELLDYYVRNSSSFYREGKRLARHIMVNTLPSIDDSTETIDSGRLWEQLSNGEDFFQLTSYSESTTAEQNGQLGWLSKGSVAEPFDEAVWSMEIGEVTGPITVRGTQHFIQLLDIQGEGLLPFEACVDEIRELLIRQKETEHRYQVLNLTPDSDGDVPEEVYQNALIAAGLAKGLDTEENLLTRIEAYRIYHEADLRFEDKVESNTWFTSSSENEDTTWIRESQTAARLLDDIGFRTTTQFDTPDTEVPSEYRSVP